MILKAASVLLVVASILSFVIQASQIFSLAGVRLYEQQKDFMLLEGVLHHHFEIHGTYPERLSEVVLPDGSELKSIDVYGFPLVYERQGKRYFLRCTGADGIDDRGAFDDLIAGEEPNFGFWLTRDTPAFYRSLIVGGCAVFLVALLVFVGLRNSLATLAVFSISWFVIFTWIVPLMFELEHFWIQSPSIFRVPMLVGCGLLFITGLLLWPRPAVTASNCSADAPQFGGKD